MTYEELKIKLDLYDPEDVLTSVGKQWCFGIWFVVCDEGDCHLFRKDGTEYDIGNVTALDRNLIHNANIKKIVIPDSVICIRSYAFSASRRLMSIMIPNSVTNIGTYAFKGCSGLTSVTIPDSVTNIGYCAFARCYSLKELVFKGKTIDDVKAMNGYPFGIKDTSIIRCI